MSEQTPAASRIVVGVDGSAGSREALRWAIRQAELTGSALEAVIAWQYPAFFGWATAGPDDADFAKLAEQTLASALTEAFGAQWPGWVHARVIEGYPAGVLTEVAEGADLLVVGCRGHGGFAGLLLGSVSQYLAHHAPCPIVIVRDGKPAA